jgi:hypothetical protein
MKIIKILLLVIVMTLTSCATNQDGRKERRGVPDVSSSFRSCFATAKRPWLADIVAGESASRKKLDRLISDFIGTEEPAYTKARNFIAARRSGKYANSEEMAGEIFSTCQTEKDSMKVEREKVVRCFWEQRVILHAMDMRLYGNLNQNQTISKLTAMGFANNSSQKEAVRRLVRDTFIVFKSGGENAFGEAQFQLCITVYR